MVKAIIYLHVTRVRKIVKIVTQEKLLCKLSFKKKKKCILVRNFLFS